MAEAKKAVKEVKEVKEVKAPEVAMPVGEETTFIATDEELVAQVQAEEKAKFEAEEAEAAKLPTHAENAGADIAAAITQGLKGATEKNFTLQRDQGVEPRFSVVKSKKTGEVMLRENESGTLSKIQLESIEEKEASIQGEEVEEL